MFQNNAQADPVASSLPARMLSDGSKPSGPLPLDSVPLDSISAKKFLIEFKGLVVQLLAKQHPHSPSGVSPLATSAANHVAHAAALLARWHARGSGIDSYLRQAEIDATQRLWHGVAVGQLPTSIIRSFLEIDNAALRKLLIENVSALERADSGAPVERFISQIRRFFDLAWHMGWTSVDPSTIDNPHRTQTDWRALPLYEHWRTHLDQRIADSEIGIAYSKNLIRFVNGFLHHLEPQGQRAINRELEQRAWEAFLAEPKPNWSAPHTILSGDDVEGSLLRRILLSTRADIDAVCAHYGAHAKTEESAAQACARSAIRSFFDQLFVLVASKQFPPQHLELLSQHVEELPRIGLIEASISDIAEEPVLSRQHRSVVTKLFASIAKAHHRKIDSELEQLPPKGGVQADSLSRILLMDPLGCLSRHLDFLASDSSLSAQTRTWHARELKRFMLWLKERKGARYSKKELASLLLEFSCKNRKIALRPKKRAASSRRLSKSVLEAKVRAKVVPTARVKTRPAVKQVPSALPMKANEPRAKLPTGPAAREQNLIRAGERPAAVNPAPAKPTLNGELSRAMSKGFAVDSAPKNAPAKLASSKVAVPKAAPSKFVAPDIRRFLNEQRKRIEDFVALPANGLDLGDLLSLTIGDLTKDCRVARVIPQSARDAVREVQLSGPYLDLVARQFEQRARLTESLPSAKAPLFVDRRKDYLWHFEFREEDRAIQSPLMRLQLSVADALYRRFRLSSAPAGAVTIQAILALSREDILPRTCEATLRSEFDDSVIARAKLEPSLVALIKSMNELLTTTTAGGLWTAGDQRPPLFLAHDGSCLAEMWGEG